MLKNKLNWNDFKIEIKNNNFSSELFKNKLDIFWKEIMETKLSENQHIWLLFRLQWTNNQFVTIGKLVKLNKEDKDYLFEYILDRIENKSDYYKETALKLMIFSYTIKRGRAKDKVTTDSTNINLQFQNYQHHKFPITIKPLEYGDLIVNIDNVFTVQINKTNVAVIKQFDEYNDVKIFKSGKLTYEYRDHKVNDSTFVRSIENQKFTFKDNKLVLLTIDKTAKYINPLNLVNLLNKKIITFDIETYLKDGFMNPYVISWTDGENKFSYFISDFKDQVQMIETAIKDLMVKKYDNYHVYIHNLAKFDGIFLLKILANLGEIKPIIHNKKIISITFKMNGYVVIFKDSQQMLIGSLRNLAKAFGVETQKSIFPYNFVNKDNLNYNGYIPDFKYFDNISKSEYLSYCDIFKNKTWNLKAEIIKYCEIDCVSLYQVITKFNELVFEKFKIDIHKYPTLSSLAFAIFRTHFLKLNTIPQLSGQIAKDIRMSYTGGAVDMYQPYNEEGTKIYCYDVNALYPFTMDDKLMPTGKPVFFKGDIREVDPNAFGFFYCNIITPTDLLHPIIQTHIKTEHGLRTIAPLGEWSDMIFSAEMDNAVKLGYKFEILWGYTFKKDYIFKNYVNILYGLRILHPKPDPLNYIAKLLLNSLYGRFGMDDSFGDFLVLDSKSYNKFEKDQKNNLLNVVPLGDKFLIKHRSLDKDVNTFLDNASETHNISIGIAAAITAYARIHMSQFKNNPNFNLYYSDTDSIYIDRPLPDEFISSTILGKMKLEYVCNKAIFLSPKVYYLETEDGKVIYKVKGLKHEVNLTLTDFELLLYKESLLEKFQNKWRKNFSEGSIEIRDELYTLRVTNNKRKLIYDENNKLIDTFPFTINFNKEVIN